MPPDDDSEKSVEPTDQFETLDIKNDGSPDLMEDFPDMSGRGDPFEESDLFEEVDVDTTDPDAVWKDLVDNKSEVTTEKDSPSIATVSIMDYCAKCPHLSTPPTMSCTHDSAEIVELTSLTEVRVSKCPIVRKRNEGMFD